MSEAYLRAQAGQRAAADPLASVFVTANAGSGKTKVLIDPRRAPVARGRITIGVFVHHLHEGRRRGDAKAPVRRLGAWCVKDDKALAKELGELMGETASLAPAQLARARALFARALGNAGGLRIQTIHAFCERLLRRFPLEAGAPPGFTIAEEPLIAALTTQALAKTAQTQGPALAHFARSLHEEALMSLMDEITRRRGELNAYLHKAGGLGAARTKIRARHGAKQDRAAFVRDFLAQTPWEAMARAVGVLAASGKNDQARAECIRIALADRTIESYFEIFCWTTARRAPTSSPKPCATPIRALARTFADETARAAAAALQLKGIDRAEDATALLTLADALLSTYTKAKKKSARSISTI